MPRPKRKPWQNKVGEILKQRNIRQKDLAERATEEIRKINPDAGVSPNYICEIVNQQACPSYDVRRAIATVFGVEVGDLDY